MSLVIRGFKSLGGLFFAILLCIAVTLPVAADEGAPAPITANNVSLTEVDPQAIDPAAFEAEVIALVNQERARYGLYPLIANTALTMAARGHSQDMSDNNFVNHVGSDGSGFVERIQRAGYTTICAAGENIAAGQTTPEQVVSAWMNSDGHRANILSAKYRDIGVGYVYEPDDTYTSYPGAAGYKHYWTQEFGVQDCFAATPTFSSMPPTVPPTFTRVPTLVWTPTPTFTNTPTWTPRPTSTWTPRPTSTWTNTPDPTATPTFPPPTSTPTVSVLESSAALVGSIELQGRQTKPSSCWVVPLMVTLLDENGTEIVRMPLYTTPFGEFVLQKLQPGIYDVRVKNPLTLANYKSTVTLVPGVNRVNLGTLLAGDSSNDNVVDVLDFSLLRATFGTQANQADFNGDGVVDVLDFSLLRAHFGLSGDIPIN